MIFTEYVSEDPVGAVQEALEFMGLDLLDSAGEKVTQNFQFMTMIMTMTIPVEQALRWCGKPHVPHTPVNCFGVD